LEGLQRFIGTSETSKHRVFHALDQTILPDNMVVALGSDSWADFGVLSSKIHDEWALEKGATLEDRPRYTKGSVFDPFPFPDRSDAVAEIAERLDAARQAALAEDTRLTMTGLYNLVAPVREGTLPPEQEAAATRARAFIVAKLHDDLDAAVADAYGWGEEWRRAPLPPAEIVRRLVALNAERAAEEAEGHIRWLRPDYQIPRFGSKK
jgi:limonene-1,2-epoxide hydrolase